MSSPLLDRLDRCAGASGASLQEYRTCLEEQAASLADRFNAGADVTELVTERAAFMDQVLCHAWRQHGLAESGATLVAVGGYGRGELHPASDIDLLILTPDDLGELAPLLESFVTFLWDLRLEIGHSVRSLAQCLEEAKADVTVITNLIESRLITGNAEAFDQLQGAIGTDRLWPSADFFKAKLTEQEARHARHSDTAYNLEPNIKENPGGLRDIQMIGWVAKRHFHARTFVDLVVEGFLTDAEYRQLNECQQELWRIRYALHLLTGSHEDRLLFEHQRALAASFGYQDESANLAVEQFMQRYYRAVMRLERLNEMLLQLFSEAILLPDRLEEPVDINRRFRARNGYLETTNQGIFARYPIALLEMFLLLQQHPELKGVRASTIRLVRAHRHLIDDRFRNDVKAQALFMEILRQPSGVAHAFRRMNRYGILARYIPAFGNIVGRMQYDLFHVFTVDEHTLRVVSYMRRFSMRKFDHEYPLCTTIYRTLPKVELVLLAALFHDIAKGRGGDHSTLGAKDAWDFCKLHQLSDYDASLVAWMVLNHLKLSVTAQREDIDDPDVIQTFAAFVGDLTRLNYLYVLTVADVRATNPKRLNSWKVSLLNQLYNSTRQALDRGLDNPQQHDELIQKKQAEAELLLLAEGFDRQSIQAFWFTLSLDFFLYGTPREIAWQTGLMLTAQPEKEAVVAIRDSSQRGSSQILIAMPDRDRLFSQITYLLNRLELNIVGARIQIAEPSIAMNSYFVLEEDGGPIVGSQRRADVELALREGLASDIDSPLEIQRRTPRQIRQFSTATDISFEQDDVHGRTRIKLITTDRPGLLSRIGQVFDEHGVRLINAKIATLGAVAEDLFVVTDTNDKPIDDPEIIAELTVALQDRLTPETDQQTG